MCEGGFLRLYDLLFGAFLGDKQALERGLEELLSPVYPDEPSQASTILLLSAGIWLTRRE